MIIKPQKCALSCCKASKRRSSRKDYWYYALQWSKPLDLFWRERFPHSSGCWRVSHKQPQVCIFPVIIDTVGPSMTSLKFAARRNAKRCFRPFHWVLTERFNKKDNLPLNYRSIHQYYTFFDHHERKEAKKRGSKAELREKRRLINAEGYFSPAANSLFNVYNLGENSLKDTAGKRC